MTNDELKILQRLSLDLKVAKSKLRIQEWYNHWGGQVYVSFSGGKDSTVLKHLVENTVGAVPSVFCDTGLEYPELKNFVENQSNVEIIKPKMKFNQVIKEYGYPVVSKSIANTIRLAKLEPYDSYRNKQLRGEISLPNGQKSFFDYSKWTYLLNAPFEISEQRCNIMKKKPFKEYERSTQRKPFIGIMAIESLNRKNAYLKTGCNAFTSSKQQSTPIAFWTEQDILQYILEFKLEYPSVYGEIKDKNGKYYTTGVKRTGCMFCMFGLTKEKEPNRFQQMECSHPNIYNYCMKSAEKGGLGIADVLDYINSSPNPKFKKINYKNK